jgi:hypothetical protein
MIMLDWIEQGEVRSQALCPFFVADAIQTYFINILFKRGINW